MTSEKTRAEPTVIFLHIPRTAGTTLYRIIERHYKKAHIYTVWMDGTPDEFKNLSQSRRAAIRVLRGHTGWGLHEFLPGPASYFTLLRDPIERVISYYYFIRRAPRHYCHDLVTSNDMSLRDFLESQADPMADNAQTRLLSGLETGQELGFGECTEELLEIAKRNLRENVAVVGLTEEFDRTLLLLKRAFGWQKLFYARQNVSANRPRKNELPPTTRDAVAEVNLLDTGLYQHATALFEEQIRQQEASFARELESFQSANQWLSPLFYAYWQMRRISVRTFVRKRMHRLLRGSPYPTSADTR
jgi:hypothetical protein